MWLCVVIISISMKHHHLSSVLYHLLFHTQTLMNAHTNCLFVPENTCHILLFSLLLDSVPPDRCSGRVAVVRSNTATHLARYINIQLIRTIVVSQLQIETQDSNGRLERLVNII
jgi:hypothetical protein